MKRSMLFVCLIAIPALAQTQTPTAGRAERKAKGAATPAAAAATTDAAQKKPSRDDVLLEQLTKELTLTTEEQAGIRTLLDESHKQTRAQNAKTKEQAAELKKNIAAAQAAGDQEKIKALDLQARELLNRSGSQAQEARDKIMADIEAMLAPQQKAKFQEIKGTLFGAKPVSLEERPEMLLRAVESLNLSADKTKKIKGLAEDWKAKAKATGDRKTGAAELYQKVMAELTPEQQEKLKQWKPDPAQAKSVKDKAEKAAKPEKPVKGEKKAKRTKAKRGQTPADDSATQ